MELDLGEGWELAVGGNVLEYGRHKSIHSNYIKR